MHVSHLPDLKSLREQYLQPTAFHPEETTTTEEDFEEATIPETEEELVSVGEDKIPLSRVTQADIERMTTEEYQVQSSFVLSNHIRLITTSIRSTLRNMLMRKMQKWNELC